MKRIRGILLLALLAAGMIVLTGTGSKAAVKLSAKKVTFAKPSTGSKTITIKGVKTSNIKKLTVSSSNPKIAKASKKGKNKVVIKAGYAGETYVYITAEYKKPVKGSYSFYGSVTVKVKGTSKIPVKTAKDLTEIQEYNENWTYVLKNDIDMSGVSLPLKNKWNERISLSNTTLDGDGHTIKNLNGPFLSCLGGTLKNIKFENFKINCKNTDKSDLRNEISHGNAAALIQYTSVGKIVNCKVSGSITLTFEGDDNFDSKDSGQVFYLEYVGGLVGRNQSNAAIERCVSDVDITLDYSKSTDASRCPHVGGICGDNSGSDYKTNTIKQCVNSGDIKTINGNCFVGGLSGMDNRSEYEDCLNTGHIYNIMDSGEEETKKTTYAGLIGWPSASTKMTNCLNNGKSSFGISGWPTNTDSEMESFTNVYNAEGKTIYMFNYLQDPFEIPGTHNVSDADLTNQSAFTGFDFSSVWTMGPAGPTLKNVY